MSRFAPENRGVQQIELQKSQRQHFKSSKRNSFELYSMAPRIAIIYYSTYGHIEKLAAAQQKGIEKAGGSAIIFQQVSHIKPTDDF
jgi:hypothetical protein